MADDTRVRVKHIKALVEWIKKLVNGKVDSYVPDMSNVTGVLSPEHGGTGFSSLEELKAELGNAPMTDQAIVTFNASTGANNTYANMAFYSMKVAAAHGFTFLNDATSIGTYHRIRVDKTGLYEIDMSPGMSLAIRRTGNAQDSMDMDVKPAILNLLTSTDNENIMGGIGTLPLGTTICECRSAMSGMYAGGMNNMQVNGLSLGQQDGYQVVYLEAGQFLKVLPSEIIDSHGNQSYFFVTGSATVTVRQIG